MQSPPLSPLRIAAAVAALTLAGISNASGLLWVQGNNGTSLMTVPSVAHGGVFTRDVEAADDFDLTGTIERVVVGADNTNGCDPGFQGIWVRFYEDLGGTPGVLQYEVFVPANDPKLVVDTTCPIGFDVTLPVPFQATGPHFLAVQVAAANPVSWAWSSTSPQPFHGSFVRWRDNEAGTPWGAYDGGLGNLNREMWFELWGQGAPPPPQTQLLFLQSKQFLGGDEADASVWTSPPHDAEAADDFELIASIERLLVPGRVCFQCPSPAPDGAWIRFYEWTPLGPGALQDEQFAPVLGSGLAWDVTLPTPFQANGKHFVSFQLSTTAPHGWGWSLGSLGGPTNESALWVRDNVAGSGWTTFADQPVADLALQVFGKDLSGQPQIFPDPCGDWTAESLPDPTTDYESSNLRGVTVAGPDDVWAAGEYSFQLSVSKFPTRPLLYHWDGSTWTADTLPVSLPTVFDHAALWDVEAAAPDDVWAVGFAEKADGAGFTNPQLLIAHYDGSDWSILQTPTPGNGLGGSLLLGIEVVAPDDVWFVGEWGTLAMPALAVHWDGSDLELFVLPLPGYGCDNGGYGLEAVSAVSTDDVWAVGGGHDLDFGICSYVVHWNGSSWTPVPVPEPGILNRLLDVEAIATNDVWAAGQYFDGVTYRAYAIHWDGSSWQLFDDLPTGSAALHAFGPDDVYAASGGIAHWDGTSWRQVSDLGAGNGSITGPSIADIDAIAPCALWGAGRQLEVGIERFVVHHTDSAFSSYCTAKSNSQGCAPVLVATGTPSLSEAASATVSAVQVVNNKAGLFFYGYAGPAAAPFLGGTLCVQPPLKRTTLTFSFGNPPPDDCSGTLSLDFNTWAQSGADSILSVGSVLHGQWWSRDPSHPDGSGVSLSNAVSFVVQ